MPNVNNNVDAWIPVGTHVLLDGVSATVTIPDNATGVVFQFTDSTGFYTIDNGQTAPNSTTGFSYSSNDPPRVLHLYPGAQVIFNPTAGGDCQYQFIRTGDHHSLTSRR